MKILLLTGGFLFCFSGKPLCQTNGNLTIRFENLESGKGTVQLALYRNAEDFLDPEKAELHSFKVSTSGTLEAKIKDLTPGTYAFASFHDEDEDKELGTNFFGIPKEPYCFSRQCPSKWRPPSFDEAKFEVKKGENQLTVSMQRWQF